MNKKFLYGIAVLAIAAVAAFNVNLGSKSDNLSGVSLANVEALADETSGCPHGCYEGWKGCWCYQWYWDAKEASYY
jgi:hypothetical protein